jgi:hypothetical protein
VLRVLQPESPRSDPLLAQLPVWYVNLLNLTQVGSPGDALPFVSLIAQLSDPHTQPHIPSGLHKLGKLNHVAIAVPDLAKAMSFYRNILQADVGEAVVRTHSIKFIQSVLIFSLLYPAPAGSRRDNCFC